MRLRLAIFLGLALAGCEGGHRPEKPYQFPDRLVSLLTEASSTCMTAVQEHDGLPIAENTLGEYLPFALAAITSPAASYAIEPTAGVTIEVTTHTLFLISAEVEYEYFVSENAEYPIGLWRVRIDDASFTENGTRYSHSTKCVSALASYEASSSSEAPFDQRQGDPRFRVEKKATVSETLVTVRASSLRSEDTWSGSYCINNECTEFKSNTLPNADTEVFVVEDNLLPTAAKLLRHVAKVNE